MKRNPDLDGIRGIAILIVVIHHFAGTLDYGVRTTASHLLSRFLGIGWFGVDIFFVLSGFLITRIILNGANKPDFWRKFYIHRVLRILPAFAVVFLATVLLFRPTQWESVLPYLFFLGNWTILGNHEIAPLNHIWSLAIEEQYYFVWPQIVSRLSVLNGLRCALAIAIGSNICRILLAVVHVNAYIIYKATFSRLDGIALGSALAIGLFHEPFRAFLLRNWRKIFFGALGISLLGFIALKLSCFAWDVRAQIIQIPMVCLMCAMTIFASTESLLSKRIQSFFGSPILQYLGKRSYGLYLIHEPIRFAIDSFLASNTVATKHHSLGLNALSSVIGISVSLLLCEASWRLVEQPAQRLRPFFKA